MFLNEDLFETVEKGQSRGTYKKKNANKLTYNKFCDKVEDGLRLEDGGRIKYKLDANRDPFYTMHVRYMIDDNPIKRNEDGERIADIYDKELLKPLTDYLDSIDFIYEIKQHYDGAYDVKINLPDSLFESKSINHRGKLIIEKKTNTPKEFTLEDQIEQLKHTLDTAKSQLDSIEKNKDSYMLDETNPRYEEMLDKYNKLVDSYKETIKVGEEKLAELSPKNESLKEDLSQEEQQEYGLNTLINQLIKSEYDAIDEYNSAIVTLETEGQGEYTDVIRSIIEDERHHIGNLQEIMNRITPGTTAEFEHGKEEAIETLDEEKPEEEEVRTTIDTENGEIKTYKLSDVKTIKDTELEDSALQG